MSDTKKVVKNTKEKVKAAAAKVDKLELIASKSPFYDIYKIEEKITKEQCAFLTIFSQNKGNISHAQRSIGVRTRQTIYNWRKNNEVFNDLFNEIKEEQIDIIESKLSELIDEKNPIAIMFALKTIGKNRGYTEKIETENTNIEVVQFDFEEVEYPEGFEDDE